MAPLRRTAPLLSSLAIALTFACKTENPKPTTGQTTNQAPTRAQEAKKPPQGKPDLAATPGASPTTAAVTFTNSCTQTIWLAEFGNGAAKSCQTNTDCNGGTCSNGSCEQVLCTKASDCTDIQFCDALSCQSDGQCPATTATACTSNSDCLSTQTCDTGSGKCTTCNANQCSCNTDADCPAEGQCIDNACTGGLCRYELTPSPGYWQLTAGAKQTLQIPIGWGGRFWARTGCPDNLASCKAGFEACTQNSDCCGGQCQAGFCNPSEAACTTGDCNAGAACDISAQAPVSLFEVFFQDGSTTWFDGSLVDGINVPLSIAAVDSSGNPLTGCSPANIGGCSKTLDTSTIGALRVATTTACEESSDCPFLGECLDGFCTAGYSGACDVCTANPSAAGLDCATNQDLYCCTGANADSCNLGNPTCMSDVDCPNGGTCTNNVCTPVSVSCTTDSDCAANYVCDSTFKACLPNSSLAATCCGPYNPSWRAAMQPFALPYKTACPNAYAYQFDDPSSNTVCNGQAASFDVTFCPSTSG